MNTSTSKVFNKTILNEINYIIYEDVLGETNFVLPKILKTGSRSLISFFFPGVNLTNNAIKNV